MTGRSAHPRTPRRGRQPTRRAKHELVRYPASETHLDGWCQRCGLQGAPGDQRHLSEDEVQAQRRYEQRKLGEGDE